VDSDPTSATDSYPKGKFGSSFLSMQVRQLAIICKFDNAAKFTWRSARRGSISKMATSGVASGEILVHARHKSVRITTVYQSRNTSTSDHRDRFFMIGEKSTGTTSTDGYNPPCAALVPFPTYMYAGNVPFQQYATFPTVQFHAPVTYHNPSIRTNYVNVTGSYPTYGIPDSRGNQN
jgi:hypothetical protein